MAVESYCDQLAGASELLRSQVDAGQNSDDVLESMYRSWQQRLGSVTHCGSPKQKSALTEAITAGPWTSEQRKELANAVLNNGGAKRNAKKSARRDNQRAHKFENLVPPTVMSKLRDTGYSLVSKLSLVARAGKSLGIELPDDKTIWRMLSLVAYQSNLYALDQEDVWAHMKTLQTYLQSGSRAPVEFVVDYPPSAALLPPDIKAHAYGASGELPPELAIPELDTILGCNKMRGGRSRKPKDGPKAKHQSTGSISNDARAEPPTQPTAALPCAALPSANCFRFRADSQIVAGHTCQTASPDVCPVCGNGKKEPEPENESQDATDDDDDAGANAALDDFEKAMLDAYEKKKGIKKKPAGAPMKVAAGSKKKPGPKAKPGPKGSPAGGGASKKQKISALRAKAKKIKLVLGCGKCRGSPIGCSTCLNPNYSGKRGPKTAMKKAVMKVMKKKKSTK